MNKPMTLSLIATALLSTNALAEGEFRQHDAHVHGVVEFNIAQDANQLLFEIIAPGADVVGFEHAPENHDQEHKIEDAEALLKDSSKLFTLSAAAKCTLTEALVTNTLEKEHDDHGHDHDKHDHDKHDHDEHHDHDHDKHDHDEHHDHDHGGHGEFNIQYQYDCENVDALKTIDTAWFKHFPSTEEIHVNLITDNAQVATELKPSGQTKIEL
ncbi:DUF2796 domain-containing protein [Vibrio sp. SCSIO 43136]|uniref:zinc uptake protein ZrgA n=1 Tax=Vibrio sp. SCSIO 43136 TaxID=2819101 RepID=UPI002075982A|nr:DUF2796 domain-containing protein [Vibrio sp. SCSIO 43136]USD65577.1 DUF2796 domain-containing protein [Vibrio sp. SCSIO 43136]